MINETIDRLAYTVDPRDIFVVTNRTQASKIQTVTADKIQKNHILAEPAARNTAACIGYAAMEILKKHGDGVMVITPSDAYIKNTAAFTRILAEAVKSAQTQNKLITIGITPTFAATGYGYIKHEKNEGQLTKRVIEFKEKPDLQTAQEYFASGEYVWNSGVFVWTAGMILSKLEKYCPEIYSSLQMIGDAMNTPDEERIVESIYADIHKISIDYAVMEPASANGEVLVIPGEFGWSDIGSWDMMHVLHPCDENGNILLGDTIAIETKNSTVYSSGKLIASIGIDNLIVVEAQDAILICNKDNAQDVKLIVDELTRTKRANLM